MTTLLQTQNLTAFYGDFQALFGVDVSISEGETVSIIGANGAGKTTLLKAICGLMPKTSDGIRYCNREIAGLAAADIVPMGIAMVPEGRRLFPSLSVEENLLVGGYADRETTNTTGRWTLETVFELFPILRERRKVPATSLSGGQQQMVAIGRALMSNPRLLLCDEISLGLAPTIIKDIYEALPKIKQHGASVVVVEQDISQALAVADQVYCLQEGRVTLNGAPSALSKNAIHHAYFGA